MELIEQKLRDSLHDLLMGKNSPNNIIITRDELQYIKDHSKDIGEILSIELELDDNLKKEVSSIISPPFFSYPLSESTKNSYGKYQGKYTIKSEIEQKFSYQDYQNWQSKNLNESNLEETKKSVPTPILNYLLFMILKYKILSEFDVFDYSSSFYDGTYKLELVLFNKKILSLSDGEIKLEYFKYYIQEEFEKLKYELEKYFAKKYYKPHIDILIYYGRKFISREKEQSDPNYRKCYELIITGIRNLVEHLKEYFRIIEKKSQIPTKLQWNADYKKFIDFFEMLINEEEIQYKGNKDKCAIYYILLDKIEVKNNGVVSIGSISKDLGFAINKNLEKIEICKLDYKKSMTTFVKKFSPLIYIPVPEKSTLLLNGKSSRDPIVKKLFNLFSIISESAPYEEIEERSLIVTFKKNR